jgi:hypothetical protein
MAEFFQTVMGHKFYEGDVPRAIRALEGLQKAVEQLAKATERSKEIDLRSGLDCAERENIAEARSLAIQQYAKDGEIEIDDDAEVSVSLDAEGNPTGAYVQAWVWVEFTANTGKGE